jgi:Putative lactococcus lactis phage r1t holin
MSVHSLFSGMFWIATLERAIRSFAASLASLLTAGGTGILDTDWGEKFSVAGMAAAVTVLLAIGGGTFGKGDGPSFIGEEKLADKKAANRPARRRRKAGRRPATAAAPTVPAQPAAPTAEQLPEPAPAGRPAV